jgi:hypothetical protein
MHAGMHALPTFTAQAVYRWGRCYVQASILRAVCSAFVDTKEPAFCNHLGSLDCIPGSAGAHECASASNVAAHRTECVDTFMGYTCGCSPGYMEAEDANGAPQCLDINECKMSDPCGVGTGKRAACHNAPGTFWCVLLASSLETHNAP